MTKKLEFSAQIFANFESWFSAVIGSILSKIKYLFNSLSSGTRQFVINGQFKSFPSQTSQPNDIRASKLDQRTIDSFTYPMWQWLENYLKKFPTVGQNISVTIQSNFHPIWRHRADSNQSDNGKWHEILYKQK